MSLLTKVVPDAIYQKRLERMKTLIELKAPAFIIWSEAKLIVRSHKMPWTYYVAQWWALRCPVWLDAEWWRWKITGKSNFYGLDWNERKSDFYGLDWNEPLTSDIENQEVCNRLWKAIIGDTCPNCLCGDTVNGKPGCTCSCHGLESIN